MSTVTVKKPGLAKGRRYLGSEITFNVILALSVILCVAPIIHVVCLSLSGREAVLKGIVSFWPVDFCTDSYAAVFGDATMWRSLLYSVGLTVLYTGLALVGTILLAYPLSRKYLPGRGFLMIIILIPMYFTGGTIPTYLWIKQLGLIDSTWSLILPILIATYNTIIMRNFFEAIPDSLEESAKLDGCNDFQILWKIILPLSTASLATIGLFYAVTRWNSFQDVKFYINNTKLYTLQMKLYQVVFNATDTTVNQMEGSSASMPTESIKAASIVFSTVPILVVYPFVQKYFVQGVMVGAVKG